MTLVHNNQVKEIRLEQLAEMFFPLVANQLLVQGEIDLMRCNGAGISSSGVNFMNDLFQRSKVLLNGLVYKNIAVSEVQDLALHTALQQTVYDLESSVGLACAGSHNQQQTILATCNRINSSVDGNALIVAGRIGVLTGIIGLLHHYFLLLGHAGFQLEPSNQFFFGGEFVQAELTLHTGQKVVLSKAITIGTIGKGQVQHLCIGHCLLQAIRNAVVIVFCFDDGDGVVRCKV